MIKKESGLRRLWLRLSYSLAPSAEEPTWRLWEMTRVYLRRIILGCLCGLAFSLLSLATALLVKGMLEALEDRNTLRITLFAAATPLLYLVRGASYYGQVYLLSNAAERLAERLRNRLYEHMQTLSLSFFENQKTGGLMATIASDVPVIQQTVTVAILEGVMGPATVIGGILVMFYLNWRMALVTIISLVAIGCVISFASLRMRRASESIQKSLGSTSALATESLGAIRVVQSFCAEEREATRFREESHRTYRSGMRIVRINGALRPVVELLGATSVAFIIWYGGMEIVHGRLKVAGVLAIFQVALEVTKGIQQISRLKMYIERVHGAAQRVFAVLDMKPEIHDAADAVPLDEVKGEIAFEDVHFAYAEGDPVLQGVSFVVRAGEALAVVGPSGAGKSTIANLIPRFYDAVAGRIRVDGRDVREVTSHSLRSHIGIVAQETVLFSGTIRDNIAYGRPEASEEEVIEAARAANAHDFITRSLPEGYETVVGERGVKLSGGQRQRIAIARAILKDPRILILDEATSALDAESEALVQEALERLMQGRTTIIIAHRLSTVRKANRILVLAQGRVQEQGSHMELLRQNGLYARLYEVGVGGDALDAPEAGATPLRAASAEAA